MRGVVLRPFPAVDELLSARTSDGGWPGVVYAFGPPAEAPAYCGAHGALALEPKSETLGADALYDLASLAKPLACAALALRFEERGVLDPDEPLETWLPELSGYAGRTPSLVDLLSHRAGFPAWAPLYAMDVPSTRDLPGSLAALAPAYEARQDVLYSCPSALAAGLALERVGGARLDELFRSQIAEPLGLKEDLRYGPLPERELARCAPTERSRAREAALVLESGADGARAARIAPGADVVLRGVVHDGNAAALGGSAGNAGLFGSAPAVFRLASEMLRGHELWGERQIARLSAVVAESSGDARTFGFQSGRAGSAPAGSMGRDSIGHVGFTGTSIWIRPEPAFVAVLLSNRVHPSWSDAPIQQWRRAYHDAALCSEAAS